MIHYETIFDNLYMLTELQQPDMDWLAARPFSSESLFYRLAV